MLARSTWGTGQDQCASIKRQLAAMLPGVSIFLDVSPRGLYMLLFLYEIGLVCDRFIFCARLFCARHVGHGCVSLCTFFPQPTG